MPREQVENSFEGAIALYPEASQQRRSGRQSDATCELDARIETLSEQLATLPADALAGALAATAETLGAGLGAECVSLFRPSATPGCLDRVERWGRDAAATVALPEQLTLDEFPDRGAALLAGRSELLAGGQPLDAADAASSRPGLAFAGWRSLGVTLFVPFIGPQGLLGLARVEGGLAASRWSRFHVGRARLVGRLMAGFLERNRLAAELEAIRVRQGHDERLETLGRVASSVAHDFNNVLTAILGYAELLEMELPGEASGREEVDEIHAAATRAADLVEQVLSFGRARKGGVRDVDVDQLLVELKSMLERVAGAGIEVVVPGDTTSPSRIPAMPSVCIDAGRLERILLNLASNARDAIHARGDGRGRLVFATQRVEVDREGRDSLDPGASSRAIPGLRSGPYLRLTASDDGCGLEPGTAERIFEPFFTTKGAASGTGLGLATAAEVVREARGGIRAASRPGGGASFHLYFPISSPDVDESAELDPRGPRV